MFKIPRIIFFLNAFVRMLPQNLSNPIGTSVDILQRYIERWLNSQIYKMDLHFWANYIGLHGSKGKFL